jgi:hypothetical protein
VCWCVFVLVVGRLHDVVCKNNAITRKHIECKTADQVWDLTGWQREKNWRSVSTSRCWQIAQGETTSVAWSSMEGEQDAFAVLLSSQLPPSKRRRSDQVCTGTTSSGTCLNITLTQQQHAHHGSCSLLALHCVTGQVCTMPRLWHQHPPGLPDNPHRGLSRKERQSQPSSTCSSRKQCQVITCQKPDPSATAVRIDCSITRAC